MSKPGTFRSCDLAQIGLIGLSASCTTWRRRWKKAAQR